MTEVDRHLRKTLAGSLPPSTSLETAVIKNCFSTGSLLSLKRLPHKLQAGTVLEARAQHIQENLTSKPKHIFKAKTGLPLFNPPRYEPHDYDKVSTLHRLALEDERNLQASSSRKPFVVTGRIELKRNDDMFVHQEYQEPPGLRSITRSSLQDSSQFLHGSFQSTCGKKKAVKEPSMGDIQSWIQRVYEAVAHDWDHLRFRVLFTSGNELQVLFASESLPPANALVNYMNHMSVHGVAAELGLTKRGDRWYARQGEDEVVFSFYAPGPNLGPLQIFKSVSAQHRDKVRRSSRR